MLLKNTDQRWGMVAQLFHWVMFLLVLGAWFAVESHEDFPKGSPERDAWMLIHKSIGITIFALVWFRLGARLAQVTPAGIGNAMQQKLAKAVHAGLYALMILMPVTGMAATQMFGKPVSWFGLIELPALLPENQDMAKNIIEIHEGAWTALLVLLALHIGGALYHHLVVKDDVLKRMRPW